MAKIIGINSINMSYFCVNCNKRIDTPGDPEEMQQCMQAHMFLANCRVSVNFTLVISNIADNARHNIFFNMDKVLQLQNIIPFPLVESEMAKILLQFPDIINVSFDIVSKSVISVMKV
uniref:Uncharacterized protein n=1 Tax=Clytia hemisphaerica TaxID=252671 RepID=A0A7M5WUI7_9CNID